MLIDAGEVVEPVAGVGMLGAERRLCDRQRPPIKWLGLAVAALARIEAGEVVSRMPVSGCSAPRATSAIASDRR